MSGTSILLFCFCLFVACWRVHHCINVTEKQKKNLLNRVSELSFDCIYNGDGNYERYFQRLRSVSFDQHFWYCLTFRDPMKLYQIEDQDCTPDFEVAS